MQWRWPGKRRWNQARDLREVREIALEARRPVPLVEFRDGPGASHNWMLAVAEEPDPGAETEREAQDHTGGLCSGRG